MTENSREILVVEDNPDASLLLGIYLRRLGFVARFANSGAAALNYIATGFRPALLITDYQMPDLSGAEVIAALRMTIPDLPCLVISGFSDQELREVFPAGTHYILKPMTMVDLEKVLASIFA